MHNQNVNDIRRDIRDSAVIDIEQISAKLTDTTDPAAWRKMLELERALVQLYAERRQVILLVGLEGNSKDSGRHGPLAPVPRPRCSSQAFGYGGTPFIGGSAAGTDRHGYTDDAKSYRGGE